VWGESRFGANRLAHRGDDPELRWARICLNHSHQLTRRLSAGI
jgi:hypothetical protein